MSSPTTAPTPRPDATPPAHLRLAEVRASMERLRTAGSASDLVQAVPREIGRIGFSRGLFSWVRQSRWVAGSAWSEHGAAEAQAMVLAGGTAPFRHTRDLLEAQIIHDRVPLLIEDVASGRRVHPELLSVTHSVSYVAAPVVLDTCVIGLLHADRDPACGDLDASDREVLSLFAEGVALLYERSVLRGRLAQVRARARDELVRVEELLDAPLDGELGAGPAGPGTAPGGSDPTLTRQLTRREIEVLRLLATGLTNAQLADRLYVSEGTVKSHVKSVLRKLGAANRAEAVSLYHRGAALGT